MRVHIAKKGKRYYVVIYEGVDASTGKPRRRWHAAGETVYQHVMPGMQAPSRRHLRCRRLR